MCCVIHSGKWLRLIWPSISGTRRRILLSDSVICTCSEWSRATVWRHTACNDARILPRWVNILDFFCMQPKSRHAFCLIGWLFTKNYSTSYFFVKWEICIVIPTFISSIPVKDHYGMSVECGAPLLRHFSQSSLPLHRNTNVQSAFCTQQNVQECLSHINQVGVLSCFLLVIFDFSWTVSYLKATISYKNVSL